MSWLCGGSDARHRAGRNLCDLSLLEGAVDRPRSCMGAHSIALTRCVGGLGRGGDTQCHNR
jgi:hypothetical protein